ncbi:MAG: mechanosensitive ion channel [Desulfatitalea sp.]|nr:mechanosensitive ion channel family protein [Desulfatitalea sp.]NNK02182.1 mechanosensitive ion channel [Desulfatitalea sp.]
MKSIIIALAIMGSIGGITCPTILADAPVQSDHPQAVKLQAEGTQEKIMPLNRFGNNWRLSAGKIFWAVVVFFVALFASKYLIRILEALSEKWTRARLLIKRITPVIHILGWASVIYFITAGIFAPPIETLIAMTASAGIAVGFASQDILKNIFGGLMILFDRPFQVGDKIQVKEFYGEVVYIGLRTVRIVTPDDSLVSIPNSEIVNQPVSNANSGEFNCQVAAEFYLPPTVDLNRVKKLAHRIAGVSRYVFLDKPITIVCKNEVHEGRSLIKLRIKAYVFDLRYEFLFISDMTETFIREIRKRKLVRDEELSYVKGPGHQPQDL